MVRGVIKCVAWSVGAGCAVMHVIFHRRGPLAFIVFPFECIDLALFITRNV